MVRRDQSSLDLANEIGRVLEVEVRCTKCSKNNQVMYLCEDVVVVSMRKVGRYAPEGFVGKSNASGFEIPAHVTVSSTNKISQTEGPSSV
jgi:hypothetical protein